MSQPKVPSPAGVSQSPVEKKVTHHEASVREKKVPVRDQETDEEEKEDETPVATRLPAKKVSKDKEMTILHKFLRR